MLGPGQALNLRILSAQTCSCSQTSWNHMSRAGRPQGACNPTPAALAGGREEPRPKELPTRVHTSVTRTCGHYGPQWYGCVDTVILSDTHVCTPQWHIHVDTVVLSEAHAWTPWYWGIQQCISESSNQTRSSQQLRMEGKEDILPILWTFQDRKIVLKI